MLPSNKSQGFAFEGNSIYIGTYINMKISKKLISENVIIAQLSYYFMSAYKLYVFIWAV